jgi:phage gpG-like protein
MSAKVRVSVDDNGLAQKFVAMQRRATAFQTPLRKAAERVKEASRANFASLGAAGGGWDPLQPEYAAWKLAHYGPVPTLVRTGNLASSIMGARGVPVEVDAHDMTVRLPEIKYAKFHQYGTEDMAAREIVITPPIFGAMTADDVKDHIMGRMD